MFQRQKADERWLPSGQDSQTCVSWQLLSWRNPWEYRIWRAEFQFLPWTPRPEGRFLFSRKESFEPQCFKGRGEAAPKRPRAARPVCPGSFHLGAILGCVEFWRWNPSFSHGRLIEVDCFFNRKEKCEAQGFWKKMRSGTIGQRIQTCLSWHLSFGGYPWTQGILEVESQFWLWVP